MSLVNAQTLEVNRLGSTRGPFICVWDRKRKKLDKIIRSVFDPAEQTQSEGSIWAPRAGFTKLALRPARGLALKHLTGSCSGTGRRLAGSRLTFCWSTPWRWTTPVFPEAANEWQSGRAIFRDKIPKDKHFFQAIYHNFKTHFYELTSIKKQNKINFTFLHMLICIMA